MTEHVHRQAEYRARLKGGPQVRRILLLLLLIALAWLCLQYSRNLGTFFCRALLMGPANLIFGFPLSYPMYGCASTVQHPPPHPVT